MAHWDEIDPSISTPDNQYAVKLLTIHRSKGLEFPVVILPYLDWRKMLTKDFAWFDPPAPIDELLPKVLLKMTNEILDTELSEGMLMEKKKSLLDNINVVYVAFTRAMERLYVFTSNKKGTDYISGEINTALKMMYEDFDLGVIELGKKEKKETKEALSPVQHFSLDIKSSSSKDKNLKIAYEILKYRSEKTKKAIDYGKTMHHLFSKVNIASDLDSVLSDALSNGYIDSISKHELREKMDRILAIDQVKGWFSEEGEKFLERELIDADGNKLRPYRIIIKNRHVTIIDYKTGTINDQRIEKYTEQLGRYKDAMLSMDYTDVETYLISIDDEKVIPI